MNDGLGSDRQANYCSNAGKAGSRVGGRWGPTRMGEETGAEISPWPHSQ